jgi:hypothetical protein
MMKTIAVIGAAGSMGSAITGTLAKAHYHVLLADHGTKCPALSMRILRLLFHRNRVRAPQTGVEVISSVREASWEADIILLATPYKAQAEVVSKIKDVVTGKVVISILNSVDGIYDNSTVSAAEELAQLLPHAKVVSAFTAIPAPNFKKTQIAGQTTDVFVAGDDEQGVSIAKQLVRDAGFNPISAGTLAMSRTLERMAELQTGISARHNYRGPVGWKVLHEKVSQDGDEQDTIK